MFIFLYDMIKYMVKKQYRRKRIYDLNVIGIKSGGIYYSNHDRKVYSSSYNPLGIIPKKQYFLLIGAEYWEPILEQWEYMSPVLFDLGSSHYLEEIEKIKKRILKKIYNRHGNNFIIHSIEKNFWSCVVRYVIKEPKIYSGKIYTIGSKGKGYFRFTNKTTKQINKMFIQ